MKNKKFHGNKLSMFNKSILTVAILSALSVGCGSNDSDPQEAVSSSVAGSVAKGIVKGGLITAYILKEDGTEGTSVGTATTTDNGTYSLTMSDSYDGTSPLLLKMTAGENTTMVCDAREGCGSVIRGGDIPLAGTDFMLTAVLPAVSSGNTVDAAITAFTNMAASKVIKDGGVSSSSILAANSQVSQLAGVNILAAEPVDISDDTALKGATPEDQRYSIMLAALASQAFTSSTEDPVTVGDMIANIASYNEDFSDGNIGDDGGLSPSALYAAATVEIEAASELGLLEQDTETQATQLVTAMQSQIAEDGSLEPTATSGDNPTEVAQAKAFITEIRTWANALQDLENPAATFLDEAEVVSSTLDSNSGAVLEVYAMTLSAAADAIGDAGDTGEDVPASIEVKNNDGDLIGSVSITDNSTASTREYIMTGSDLSGVSINTSISLDINPSDSTIGAGVVNLNVSGSASNDKVSISIADAVFTVTLAEDLNTESGEPVLSSAALSGKLSAETMNGSVSTGNKIEAQANVKFVVLDSSTGGSLNNDLDVTLEKIALDNLSVTNGSSETAGLSASLTINNAASFDTWSYLTSQSEISTHINIDADDIDFSILNDEYGYTTITSLSYDYNSYWEDGLILTGGYQTCFHGMGSEGEDLEYRCEDGDVLGLNEQIDLDTLYPQSHIKDREVSSFSFYEGEAYADVNLSLDNMETAESFLDATINITGKVDLAEHDEATLTITANKTGIDAGNMTATLGYSGKSIQLGAEALGGESNTAGTLSFSNADGVALTVSSSNEFANGSVKVGDAKVGTIENQDGLVIIRYNDGTFESL